MNHIACNKEPFDGFNIIFSGDFFQLSPVGDTTIGSPTIPRTKNGDLNEKKLKIHNLARELWETVDSFSEFMSTKRTSDPIFSTALQILRLGPGDMTEAEYKEKYCSPPKGEIPSNFAEAVFYMNCRFSPTSVDLIDKSAHFLSATWKNINPVNDRHVNDSCKNGFYHLFASHRGIPASKKSKKNEEQDEEADLREQTERPFNSSTNPLSYECRKNLSGIYFKCYNNYTKEYDGKNDPNALLPNHKFAIGQRILTTKNLSTKLGVVNGSKGQ